MQARWAHHNHQLLLLLLLLPWPHDHNGCVKSTRQTTSTQTDGATVSAPDSYVAMHPAALQPHNFRLATAVVLITWYRRNHDRSIAAQSALTPVRARDGSPIEQAASGHRSQRLGSEELLSIYVSDVTPTPTCLQRRFKLLIRETRVCGCAGKMCSWRHKKVHSSLIFSPTDGCHLSRSSARSPPFHPFCHLDFLLSVSFWLLTCVGSHTSCIQRRACTRANLSQDQDCVHIVCMHARPARSRSKLVYIALPALSCTRPFACWPASLPAAAHFTHVSTFCWLIASPLTAALASSAFSSHGASFTAPRSSVCAYMHGTLVRFMHAVHDRCTQMHRDTTTARVAQPLTSGQQHQCTSAIHTCSVSSSGSESRTHTPCVRQAHACAQHS
jgi:hypothetical protein